MSSCNIQLNFGLNNLPSLNFEHDFKKVLLVKEGDFMLVLTNSNHIELYTVKYGFKLISRIDLVKPPKVSLLDIFVELREFRIIKTELLKFN